MSQHQELFHNPAFMADLQDFSISSRAVAAKWGVGKTFINKHRNKPQGQNYTETEIVLTDGPGVFTASSNGDMSIEEIKDKPVTLQDARNWVASAGDDPEEYNISIRAVSKPDGTFSNKITATPKRKKLSTERLTREDFAKASTFIENFTYIPPRKDFLVDLSVIQPTDEQLGKTDYKGGTDQTVERAMNSYAAAAEYIKEYRPREVLLAHTGDPIENVCNTSSQRDTNDLDLPHQLLAAYKLDLAGIKMVSPHAERIVSAYVPSNHGRWRVGPKADGGDAHADFGIVTAKQIAHTLEEFKGFENVEIMWPEHLMESMTVRFSTVNIGLVHGHQAGGPDKMGDWWAKQSHGRMPTWDADALFVGHWHSYRAYQSGDARHVFVGPTNEPGSSWYANLKGERSTAGMLAVSFIGKKWKFQEIL